MRRRTLIATVATGALVAATSAYGVSRAAIDGPGTPRSGQALQAQQHTGTYAGAPSLDEMRSIHRRMMRDPALRRAHDSMAADPQMRRHHAGMMRDPAMRRMHEQMMGGAAGMHAMPRGMNGRR